MQSVMQAWRVMRVGDARCKRPPTLSPRAHQRASSDDQSSQSALWRLMPNLGFARRGPAIRAPSPPSLRSGGPPSREDSGGYSKASFAR
ncbi:hypothetical protein BD309DRAFT_971099 [Dichomitus squalens]|nr:hypothetical protein BD309DRAFT_971099 [Dichomitus squalens]